MSLKGLAINLKINVTKWKEEKRKNQKLSLEEKCFAVSRR